MENREPQESAAIQGQETQGSLLLWESTGQLKGPIQLTLSSQVSCAHDVGLVTHTCSRT